MLHDIQQRYTPAILAEALRRFGFSPTPLLELEGSAFVYEGLLDGLPRILKIAPGIWNSTEQITGSTREQLLAEVDFVRYLAKNGLPVALPVPSRSGNWVELLPLDEHACFLAYAFEKAPGEMYPDEDEVHFPTAVLVEWGRLSGQLHRLSASYHPHPERQRLPWHVNDLLDFSALIPPEQTRVHQRRAEILARLHALPQDAESYGLVHGDFHHGNFLVEGEKITLFDFDAAEYFWYAGEVCVALYNCLPLPRGETARRRTYALDYLTAMFTWNPVLLPVSMDTKFRMMIILAAIFAFMAVIKGMEEWQGKVLEPKFNVRQLGWRMAVGFAFFILCVGSISSSSFNPFIYFRF